MHTPLFRHSDVQDPYGFYATMLMEDRLIRDKDSGAWIIYQYAHCQQLLHNGKAQIPGQAPGDLALMNDYCLRLIRNLVRLRNPSDHLLARLITLKLFETKVPVSISGIMERLLPAPNGLPTPIDWMGAVANQLPIRILAESFGFSPADTARILATIGDLVRIMSPVKTPEQIDLLNEAVEEIYLLTERRLHDNGIYETIQEKIKGLVPLGPARSGVAPFDKDSIPVICVSNLMGLFIQSYDAGRGILGNSLLQLLLQGDRSELQAGNRDYIASAVQETLRYDPSVHNTRRILTEDILLDNIRLEKGQSVVLMLAAANRDARQFARPEVFDPYRDNNHELLTFGSGSHECIARHFSAHMATEALLYLFQAHPDIQLLARPSYAPLVNVRVPNELLISDTFTSK
ncbi:MAG TPA: cytochrome P450 [Puia sp.]|nr:cytochrome P450 [Puia sp.]